MTDTLTKKILRTLFPALLLLAALHSAALGCQTPTFSEHYVPKAQINACHVDLNIAEATPCCDSITCHRNSSPLRHLGSPEFANQIKDILPLILETRQPVPEPRIGLAFNHDQIDQHSTYQRTTTSTIPRHALSFLRTTILLH